MTNIVNIVDNDSLKDLKEYINANKIKNLNDIVIDDLNLSLYVAINDKRNIFKYLLENDFVSTNLLETDNPIREAMYEKNKEIISIALDYYKENDNNISNKIINLAIKDGLNWIDLYSPITFDILKKIIKSNIENKDDLILDILKEIDIHKDENIFDGKEDLSLSLIEMDCGKSLNYLIDNEYLFSKYNDFDFLKEVAIDNESYNCVKLLLNAGLNLNVKELENATEYVSKNFDLELLQLLGQDIYFSSMANKDGKHNLLLLSIMNNNKELTNWCLDKKVNVNRVTEKNENALTLAVDKGDLNLISRLIKAGCDVNHKDNNKNTPLLLAIGKDDAEIVKLLTEEASDVKNTLNDKNNYEVNAINLAIANKNYEILSYLFFLTPDISTMEIKNTQVVDIEEGVADIEAQIMSNDFSSNKLDALKILGYNFNVCNDKGENILFCYVKNNSSNTNIMTLLGVGCDITEKNKDNYDVVEYCLKNGFAEKLGIILNETFYKFEKEKVVSLLKESDNQDTCLKVLLNNKNIINSSDFNELSKIAIQKNTLIEDYFNFSKLTIMQKNVLLKQSIEYENVFAFHEIINDITNNVIDIEKMNELYKKTSNEFKEMTNDLYEMVKRKDLKKNLKLK